MVFIAQLSRVVRWLALAMVLATIAIVVLRYVFSVGAIPLQESVTYMHGILFLLGIPYGIQQNTHVRVDLIYSRLNKRQQDNINLLGHLIFLIPIAGLILYTSVPYALASWRVLEGSAEVGGIPAIFLLKTFIPIMAVLMLAQATAEIGKIISRRKS